MNEFRVLACGGRDYDDQKRVFRVLNKALEAAAMAEKSFVLIHGGAKGADALSGVWASMQKDRVEMMYIAWLCYDFDPHNEVKPEIVFEEPESWKYSKIIPIQFSVLHQWSDKDKELYK